MNIRRARSSDMPRLFELLWRVNNVHADGCPDYFKYDRTKYSAYELETLVRDNPISLAFYAGRGMKPYFTALEKAVK